MGYVTIKEASDKKLHLAREPTTRSWAILFGLISLGLGAAYYSYDYIWWKIAYVSGAIFVGLSTLEDWEECILDKETKKVTIKKQNLAQKVFNSTDGAKIIVADLDDIYCVQVAEESVKYSGIGYIVTLHFGAGYQLGITETTSTSVSRSEHEYIAEKINNFLGLDPNADHSGIPLTRMELSEQDTDPAEVGAAEPAVDTKQNETADVGGPAFLAEDQRSSTDESDDSFEQIDKTDLINFDETQGQYVPTEKNIANENDSDTAEQDKPENLSCGEE